MTKETLKFTLIGWLIILIWSTCAPFIKLIMIEVEGSPFQAIFLYNLVAAGICLTAFFFSSEKWSQVAFSPKLFLLIFLNGFYDVLVTLAVFAAINPNYAILSNYLWPILLTVFLSLKWRQHNPLVYLSCATGLVGVGILLFPQGMTDLSGNRLAIGLGLAAALCWAGYSALLEYKHQKISLFLQGTAQAVSALVALFILLILSEGTGFKGYSVKGSLMILIYGAIHMSLAYVLWIKLVTGHADMRKFAATTYLLPILSVIWTGLIFSGTLTIVVGISGTLVLGGIWIAQMAKGKPLET